MNRLTKRTRNVLWAALFLAANIALGMSMAHSAAAQIREDRWCQNSGGGAFCGTTTQTQTCTETAECV